MENRIRIMNKLSLFPPDLFYRREITALQQEIITVKQEKEKEIEILRNEVKRQNRIIGALTKKY